MPPGNTPPPSDPFWISVAATSPTSASGFQHYIDAASTKRKFNKKIATNSSFDPTIPLIAKPGFTFGCDPEGFLFDKKTGKPVPAVGIVKGTKWEPFKVDKGATQVDGMAAEFNILPAATYEEWENNIATVISQLEAQLPDSLELRWVPSVEFDPAVFDPAPDTAKELGCMPDIDAWTGGTNPPPEMVNPYVRCAGGHLHFGFTSGEDLSDLQHLLNCQDVAKQADWLLGGWSYYHDEDTVRRQLYGKMGAIRYKDYGVEYRVLSNFWVPNKALRLEVWNRMVATTNSIANYYLPDRAAGSTIRDLRRAINEHVMTPELAITAIYPIQTLDSSFARM